MNNENNKLKKQISTLLNEVDGFKEKMLELTQRSDIQDSMNEMLSISLMHISLDEQMDKILTLILDIPWLSLDKKGCIFLTNQKGTGLDMIAHHNLGKNLLGLCKKIKFGQCLCGKAAESQQLIFRNCVDKDHDIRPEGMQPHGHYNMPIISNNKTLGVLNLYVKHGHKQTKIENDFLLATAKAMASIIERKKIEEKLYELSFIDELTSIPNRRHFMNYLSQVLSESAKFSHSLAVLFLDLDYFKVINDNHGHEIGDLILKDVAERIKKCLRDTDYVARLGGDEFIVIIERVSTNNQIKHLAGHIIETVSKPYSIKSKELNIGASIGISLFPTNGTDPSELLKKADVALYNAKDNRGNVIFYNNIENSFSKF